MLHTKRYSFRGFSRLVKDAGISESALSRLLDYHPNPSAYLVNRVTNALSKELGFQLDTQEVVAEDGKYPTASACELCGCRGCLPPEAYDSEDRLKPEYRNVKPGSWSSKEAR